MKPLRRFEEIRQKLIRDGTFLLTLMSHGLDVQGGNLWGFGEFGHMGGEDSFELHLHRYNIYAFSTSNRAFGRYMEEILKIFDIVSKHYSSSLSRNLDIKYDSEYRRADPFLQTYRRAKAVGTNPSAASRESRKMQKLIESKSLDTLYAHETIPICITV